MTRHIHLERTTMQRVPQRALPVRIASIIVLLVACLTLPSFAQGFGSSKKKVTLHRKLPPTAHLNGNTIDIQVTVTFRPTSRPIFTTRSKPSS